MTAERSAGGSSAADVLGARLASHVSIRIQDSVTEDVMRRIMSARRSTVLSGRRNQYSQNSQNGQGASGPASGDTVDQLPYSFGVKKVWRLLGDAFWALDRALGGHQRPTRLQQWVARHPVGAGLCLAVPLTLFFWLIAPEGEPGSLLFAVIFALPMGLVFGLTAVLERLRQRRLKRLGVWDGS